MAWLVQWLVRWLIGLIPLGIITFLANSSNVASTFLLIIFITPCVATVVQLMQKIFWQSIDVGISSRKNWISADFLKKVKAIAFSFDPFSVLCNCFLFLVIYNCCLLLFLSLRTNSQYNPGRSANGGIIAMLNSDLWETILVLGQSWPLCLWVDHEFTMEKGRCQY